VDAGVDLLEGGGDDLLDDSMLDRVAGGAILRRPTTMAG
jgi:hypothetical protein